MVCSEFINIVQEDISADRIVDAALVCLSMDASLMPVVILLSGIGSTWSLG